MTTECRGCFERGNQDGKSANGPGWESGSYTPVILPNDPPGPIGTSAPTFAGLFGRCEKGISLKEISDGTINVIMVGEQINSRSRYTCVHCPNFPSSATNISVNTMLKHKEGALSAGSAVMQDSNDPEIGGYAQACGYKRRHPGGAQFSFTDGSVHMLNETINFYIYNLLGARSSGEPKLSK